MINFKQLREKAGKSSSGYDLYHKTFSGAMQHAYAFAKKKGYTVDSDDIDNKVATGPRKPSSGKTNSYILKTDKKNRHVHIQVANLDNKRYELNMYIESVTQENVELEERFTPKEIKMAIGIASDKRYAGGNYSGAVRAIEKIKRGLSNHKQVAAVLKRQNEEFKPHKMYDPETGKEVDANTQADHEKYAKMGYTHEKPEVKEGLKNIKGKDGKIYSLDLDNQGRKVMVRTKNNFGDIATIPLKKASKIFEGLKTTHVVVDTAQGNKVVSTAAGANAEKNLRSSIASAERPPLNIKDKKTLKIVKLKKPVSDKKASQMVGSPLKESTEELNEGIQMPRSQFDYLKKGDKLTIHFDSSIKKGHKVPMVIKSLSRSAKYNVDKINLVPQSGRGKFTLYSRQGKDATLAMGDMATVMTRIEYPKGGVQKEQTEFVVESIDLMKVAKAFEQYAKKIGYAPDKKDFMKIAGFLRDMGKNSNVNKNDATFVKMKRFISNMDTDPRDGAYQLFQKHGMIKNNRLVREQKEEVNKETLSEALSKKLSDREVKALSKKYNMGKDEISDLLNDYSPAKSARPRAWLAHNYPVRDGDYYFSFISDDEKKNTKFNSKLNDVMRKAAADRKVTDPRKGMELIGQIWSAVSTEIKKYPRDLGWNDTMTREEIYASIQHLVGVKEEVNEALSVDKMRVGKRKKAPKYEGVIGENYRTLARKGMGTEPKNSVRVGLELDFYEPKLGDKRFGVVTKVTNNGYMVKSLDRQDKGKVYSFAFHDRAKAKKLLVKTDSLSNIIKKNTIKKGKFAGYMTDEVEEAVSPAQQAAIAIAKKEKGEKPKTENRAKFDALRHMGGRKGKDSADIDIKATDDDRKAADKNIIVQLRRVADLPKGGQIEFKNGKKVNLKQNLAMAVLKKYEQLKRADDKLKFQNMAGQSPQDLQKALKLR